VFDTVGSGNRDNAYRLISALSSSDYKTVYSVIDETFMKSADISVFWQEIIDAYRDVMVVKSVDSAKEYLDLTELEYEGLVKIAREFSMAKLSYHTSILEAAMADMQRAVNSKRSIAEIALTRMCDAKLSASPEALAVRLEEMER
jgi:DNA polymerase III gamma/tau subunit